ncbi:MAG: EAL domain-containing protein, partial [Cyanobacteria bacterium J06632_22]
FLAPDFIEQLAHLVPSEYISNIKLEVTESILMAGDQARQTLHICREMGFHISLDDFGTGFSSLSYLSDLEVDSIKIDQAFVRKMLAHHRTFVLTKTMLAMTHDLGMVSIAEGIETAEQQDVLKSLGCHIGQGYLYSPPIKLSEALTQLTDA